MNVKEAALTAIHHVEDVFKSEKPVNIGLEEIVLNEDEDIWEVTIGFSRPWDFPRAGALATLQVPHPKRQYKIVRIDNKNGQIKSIKILELKNA